MFKFSTAAAATAIAFAASAANASFIDFETGFTGDKTAITGNEFEAAFGVTFSSPNGLNIVKSGAPTDGFVPNDAVSPAGAFGDYFLTSDFGNVTSLSISYTTAVSEASFDVADIDGSGSQLEEFVFKAFDIGGNLLDTIFVDGNDANAGDAQVTRIGFSGLSALISSIEITGTTTGGTRLIGIAFDNFNTDTDTTGVVPLPAGLPLLAAGLGVMGFVGRRKKAKKA